MKIFLKKIAGVLIVFIILASLMSMGSLWSLRKSSFYKPSFLINTIEETEFDYIIIGASTGLTTLNTKYIDSSLNINGINLSMDDTGIPSQYLMLQHFLAEGKTTKYCIIAPGVSSYNTKNEKLSDNDYRFLMFNNRGYVQDYYRSFEGTDARVLKYSKYAPFVGVSYYNAELFYPSLLNTIQPKKRNRFDEKGNYTYPVIVNRNKENLKLDALEIDFTSGYLRKIKMLCEANDITLICYISPIENKNVFTNTKEFSVINHSRLIRNTKYFYDTNHVNSLGRTITSEAFAKAFLELMTKRN